MNFIETWSKLDKLYEWRYADGTSTASMSSPAPAQTKSTPSNTQKNYEVAYYEDGVRKSFTVTAGSRSEALQIAWSKVDADSVYVSELDEELDLDEAKRVIHDVDILYHFTNPTPFFKIFTGDCLRGDVKLNAVCLTTDRDYRIYGYPCGIQFSRKMLEADGYELIPFDEFADDPEAAGESEERIYGNIDNVSKYVTAVHIYWQGNGETEISVVQSAEGDRIGDAEYDDQGNENENYDLMLSDFRALLRDLKHRGIKVVEHGTPMSGEYYLDADGKLQRGQMLMSIAN